MQSSGKQMLALWGSPSSGKTTTAVKLATELAKQKKNVVVVLCDLVAPALPTVLKAKKTPEVSVGAVLSAPAVTQELILKNLAVYDKNPYISLLGYKANENAFSYAEYSKERAVDMLVLLRHIADYVIVDCSSALTDSILSTAALEIADEVLRLCSCDLKAISYYMSILPLLADSKFHSEKHIKVLSMPRSYEGGAEYDNAFGGVKFKLPYVPAIEEQAAALNLTEPLARKDGKAYEAVIAAITREVFGNGE